MNIPVIDFASYDESRPETLKAIAVEVERALTEVGFMSVSNLGLSKELVDAVFAGSRDFFALPSEEKNKIAYNDPESNFGYMQLGEERLNPNMPPDLKETLTARNLLEHYNEAWPSEQFRDLLFEFYRASLEGARRLQVIFSRVLDIPDDFFTTRNTGENISLRLLHYPPVLTAEQSQLGAGAHTDYGTMTLLFQDMVGGLEVQDDSGQWIPLKPVPDTIVINTGDLMECWTNNYFRSTRHRVQPRIGSADRYSIALFIDPDSEVMVECLPSCVSENNPPAYEPMTAGEHILQKIKASQGIDQ